MKPSMDSTSPAQIEDLAARWFWRRDSEDWSQQQQAGFDAWLNESTAHRIAYIRLRAGWNGAGKMKALGAGVPPGVIPEPGSWGNDLYLGGKGAGTAPVTVPPALMQRRFARWNSRPAVAAVAIVAACALGLCGYIVFGDRGERFETVIGGLDTVALKDGSRVTLNTDTQIRVSLGESERRVELDRGEAYFDVARDSTRPFVVYARDKRMVAVGTKFSVRRYDGGVEVVVTEGRVNLEQIDSPLSGRVSTPVPTALRAGAIARTTSVEVMVHDATPTEALQTLSWRSGYLVFEATPLSDAVAQFNRYNTRKIVIDDPSIAAFRIGGNFRSDNIDAFLWLLQAGFAVHVDRQERKILLRAK